jgi:hypothetical protein
MRIISGGTKLTPLRELYKETGLLELKDRWENHTLIQLFKIQNDLTTESLSTLTPNRFQDVHTYNPHRFNLNLFQYINQVPVPCYATYSTKVKSPYQSHLILQKCYS